MSFMVATPELLATAAGDLESIAAALQGATAAAASPTTGISAAAADEVSAAVAQLFGRYGQEFQALSARGAAWQADLTRLLNNSAAAYLGTDVAQALGLATGGSSGPAATAPGGAYQSLFTNTAANLGALGAGWGANPLPFLRQFLANQQTYAQGFATALASTVQNFPTNAATFPAAVEVAFEQFASFDAAYYAQNFIATQLGFAQTFVTASTRGLTSLVAGLPKFFATAGSALETFASTGNYNAAISQLAGGYRDLLITGYDTSNYSYALNGNILDPTNPPVVTGAAYPQLVGPLEDFFTVFNLPGQEAQYLTNLMPPSTPRQMAQNFSNVLNALTLTNVEAQVYIPLTNPQAGFTTLTYSLPLVLTYSLAGPPFAALDAFGSSVDSFNHSLATGNALAAVSTVVDAPANILNGFLNGEVFVDDRIPVPLPDIVIPTGLPAGFPQTFTIPTPKGGSITPHIPFDGLLVPPHYLTATVDIPGEVIPTGLPMPFPPTITVPGVNFEGTVYGTPFMGMAPLLINYVPQQLALAIKPTN